MYEFMVGGRGKLIRLTPWRMPWSQPRWASLRVCMGMSGPSLPAHVSSAKRLARLIGLVKQLHSHTLISTMTWCSTCLSSCCSSRCDVYHGLHCCVDCPGCPVQGAALETHAKALFAMVCMMITNNAMQPHMRPHVERAKAASLTSQRASCSRLSVSSLPAPPQERSAPRYRYPPAEAPVMLKRTK